MAASASEMLCKRSPCPSEKGRLVGVQLGDRAGWRIAEEDLLAFVERQKNVRVIKEEVGTLGAKS